MGSHCLKCVRWGHAGVCFSLSEWQRRHSRRTKLVTRERKKTTQTEPAPWWFQEQCWYVSELLTPTRRVFSGKEFLLFSVTCSPGWHSLKRFIGLRFGLVSALKSRCHAVRSLGSSLSSSEFQTLPVVSLNQECRSFFCFPEWTLPPSPRQTSSHDADSSPLLQIFGSSELKGRTPHLICYIKYEKMNHFLECMLTQLTGFLFYRVLNMFLFWSVGLLL